MRAILASILLVTAALAGCIQQGEELSPNAGAPDASDDAQDQGSEESGSESGSPSGGTSGSTGSSSNQTAGSTDDGESDTNDTSQGDTGQADDTEPQPEPFNLTGTVEIGYLAVFGTDWLGGPAEENVGDNGLIDASHCPSANVTVPASTDELSILVHDEVVDPDEPGVGAYEITIHSPQGEEVVLDWIASETGDGSMNWSTEDPASGNWTIETDPIGPVVDQAWAVDYTLSGEAVSPPTSLSAETTC